jgi:WD40 repeat protein
VVGSNPNFLKTRSVVLQAWCISTKDLQVVIWDDAKQKAAITLEFRTAVRRVRLSRNRIVVALQNSVHVYVFSSPPEKVSVSETADNPLGLCCLSSRLLAFPGRTPGQVQLVEIETGNVTIVPAHTSSLRAIEISSDGAIMATASETVSAFVLSILMGNV